MSSESSPTIRQSKLSGSTFSLAQTTNGGNAGTGKVALSQLEGQVARLGVSTLQCFNNYDANLAAVTCP